MNSDRWRLDAEASAQRNRTFWQLFLQDTWLVRVSLFSFSVLLMRDLAEFWIWETPYNQPCLCGLRDT